MADLADHEMRMCISEKICQDLVHRQVLLLFCWIWKICTVGGACNACSGTIRHCCHHVGDVRSAQCLLTSLAPAVRHGQGCELGDPRKGTNDVHDVDSTRLWLRAGRSCSADLQNCTHNVGGCVGDVCHDALREVEATVAIGSAQGVHLFHGLHGGSSASRDELLPARACVVGAGDLQDSQPVRVEIAVLLHCGTHGGHFSEVGHQRGEVTNAKCSRVHCLTACIGCKGQVGGDPSYRSDEPSDAGCTTGWGIVWAPDAIILNGLVKEDHGLAEVSSPLNHIDHTLRADPRKLFRLRVIEEVIEIAQRLLQFQGLGMLHHLLNARNLLPLLDSGHIKVLGLQQSLR
eukprot:Skav200990  [mRNA]  locus=scaffold991:41207:42531:- [translate_table: standard]